MALQLKILGQEKLKVVGGKFVKAKDELFERVLAATNTFGNDAIATIKSKYLSGPRPDRLGVGTGNLRSKIRFRVQGNRSRLRVTFGTDVKYAAIHEYGGTTSPTFIFPKKTGGALSFLIGGRRIFATHVIHPGSKIPKRPFLRPGVEDEMPKFQDKIYKLMNDVVAESMRG